MAAIATEIGAYPHSPGFFKKESKLNILMARKAALEAEIHGHSSDLAQYEATYKAVKEDVEADKVENQLKLTLIIALSKRSDLSKDPDIVQKIAEVESKIRENEENIKEYEQNIENYTFNISDAQVELVEVTAQIQALRSNRKSLDISYLDPRTDSSDSSLGSDSEGLGLTASGSDSEEERQFRLS